MLPRLRRRLPPRHRTRRRCLRRSSRCDAFGVAPLVQPWLARPLCTHGPARSFLPTAAGLLPRHRVCSSPTRSRAFVRSPKSRSVAVEDEGVHMLLKRPVRTRKRPSRSKCRTTEPFEMGRIPRHSNQPMRRLSPIATNKAVQSTTRASQTPPSQWYAHRHPGLRQAAQIAESGVDLNVSAVIRCAAVLRSPTQRPHRRSVYCGLLWLPSRTRT
jgi:hypothetical protein